MYIPEPGTLAYDVATILADMLTGALTDHVPEIELIYSSPDVVIVNSDTAEALLQALTLIYSSSDLIALHIDQDCAHITRLSLFTSTSASKPALSA